MKFTSLTPRERDVLRLVPSGMRNKQIAKKLGITERTVKLHRSLGMRKLGVVNAAELVGLVRDGLDVEDPIRSSLKNARRLLLALSNRQWEKVERWRGTIYVRTKVSWHYIFHPHAITGVRVKSAVSPRR